MQKENKRIPSEKRNIVNGHSTPQREFIPKSARKMVAVAADLGGSIEPTDGQKAVTVPARPAWRGDKPLRRVLRCP